MRAPRSPLRRLARFSGLVGCAVAVAAPAHAQRAMTSAGIGRGLSGAGLTTDVGEAVASGAVEPSPAEGRRERLGERRPWAILASAAVAGSGQAMLGQDRFLAYFAVEAYAWARYVADARQGRRERRAYRRLAAQVARAPFTSSPRDGDWDYYERMEHYVESGVFDRGGGSGGEFVPEVDTSTYNGALWLLARQTYWTDPESAPERASQEWKRAEQFYRSRAITADRRWSWRNALLEYDEFRRTIRRSNEGLRRSLTDIGVVIANHALSTVDAFVTVRLRDRAADGERGYRIEVAVPFELRR